VLEDLLAVLGVDAVDVDGVAEALVLPERLLDRCRAVGRLRVLLQSGEDRAPALLDGLRGRVRGRPPASMRVDRWGSS